MIPADKGHLRHSGMTHPGLGGKPNQDRFQVAAYTVGEGQRPAMLAVLADGIGGRRAGDVAAQLALESIVNSVAQSHASQPTGILQAAIIRASQVIQSQAENNADLQGMGSTCLVAWVLEDRLYAAGVGNSRLYLLRNNRLLQMNEVHEFIREDDDEKGQGGKGRGRLRAYLGSHRPVEPDFRLRTRPKESMEGGQRHQGYRLRPNDRLLLCSDGLSDVLTEEQIRELLGQGKAEEAADLLVQAVLKGGGEGNVSAVVLAVPPARPTHAQERRMLGRRWAAAILGSLLLILISLLAWQFWVPLLEPGYTPEPTPLPTHTPIVTNTPEG